MDMPICMHSPPPLPPLDFWSLESNSGVKVKLLVPACVSLCCHPQRKPSSYNIIRQCHACIYFYPTTMRNNDTFGITPHSTGLAPN